MGKVKVAAVGAGMWGRNIVRVLKSMEKDGLVSLEAVIDVNEEAAKMVAKEFGVSRYLTDVAQIPSLGIDAATIAVPISELVRVGKVLAVQGVHVFIEKPVALRPEEIEELIKVVRASGVVAQPGFIVRYDPSSLALKDELSKYGGARYAVFKRLSRRPPHRRKFPIVYDLMIHDIDLALHILGKKSWKVLSVHATEIEDGVPQVVSAHLRLGSIHVVFVADGLLPVKVREAEIITNDSYVKASFTEREVKVIAPSYRVRKKVYGKEPLRAELEDFITRIKGGRPENAPTLEDALNACRIASEIHLREFG